MAGIDDITPHVEIEGGDEAVSTLRNIGTEGEQAFNKVGTAAEGAAEFLSNAEAAAKRLGITYEELASKVRDYVMASAEAGGSPQPVTPEQALGPVVAMEEQKKAAHETAALLESNAQKARDAAQAMNHLGTMGAEAFAKILESAARGDLTGIVTKLGGELAGAITKLIQVSAEFVEKSAEMVETLHALSEATGMAVPELIGLKDAFASVGISTTGFERAVGRLAITIANEWASIQQNVRTSADQQTAAMLHVQETAFGVQKAYQALQSALTSTAQTAAHDALGIESAALSLKRAQDALSQAAAESLHNSMSIEGAQLSLKRAQMNLARDSGQRVNPADEKALKLEQDKLAVRQAEQALIDAIHKKSQESLKVAEDELKLRQAQQALKDARVKEIEDSLKGMNELKQAQMNISKARLADSEAAERQHEMDLKSIPKIAAELAQVSAGQKTWAEVTNATEISTQNLTKALIKNAAAGGEVATTKQVFEELAKLLPQMGDSADAQAKKIALMQHTMAAGFRSGQASAAQMLAVFQRGPEYLHALQKSAEELEQSLNFKQVETNLIRFNGAFASMNTVIDLFRAKLASILSVPLTAFFDTIAQSLKSPEGSLNKLSNACLNLIEAVAKLSTSLLSGLGGIAGPVFTALASAASGALNVFTSIIDAVRKIVEAFGEMTGFTTKLGNMGIGATALAVAITGIGRALAGVLIQFAFWAIVIGVVTTATGLLIQGLAKLLSLIPGFQKSAQAMGEFGQKIEGAGQAISRANAKAMTDAAGMPVTDKQLNEAPAFFGKSDEKSNAAAEHLDQSGTKLDTAAGKQESAASSLENSGKAVDSGASKLTDAGNSIINNASFAAEKLGSAAGALTQAAANLTAAAASANKGSGKATGGHIRGPGGPTDDKAGLFALSDGEYVMKTAAVEHYGAPLFEALNNMNLGGFAMGGQVGGVSTPRAREVAPAGPTSILNLAIDGQRFDGLTAPDHVAAKLKHYAVSRETTTAGRRPSWAS